MVLQGIPQWVWRESQQAIIDSNLHVNFLPGINVKFVSEESIALNLSLFGLWVYCWKIPLAQCYQVSWLNFAESCS